MHRSTFTAKDYAEQETSNNQAASSTVLDILDILFENHAWLSSWYTL
jgi:hypothetical protein